MAVVTFGLYMSAYGKTLISPTVEKKLSNVWNILSSAIESIVFIMGGMILGREFISPISLNASDIYKLFIVYVFQLIVRFFVILSHYPILRKYGNGISVAKIVVLTLGGIKGVISTALAIIAANSLSYDLSFRGLVLFFTIGITFLTIALNPILLKLFQLKFPIEYLTDIQENMFLRVTSAILQLTQKKLEKLEKSKQFPLVKWADVVEIAGPRELVVAIMNKSAIGKAILKKYPKDSSEMLISRFYDYSLINENILNIEIRRRFYRTLKGIYWHEFESGQCLGQTSLILIKVTSSLQHKDHKPIEDWKLIESEVFSKKIISFFARFFDNRVFSRIFRRMAYNRIIKAYDAASTFIKAHKKARMLFKAMDIDQSELELIIEESQVQQELCQQFLNEYIIDQYPEIISEVQSKMATYALLISQRKLINKIHQNGLIKILEYKYLLTAIDSSYKDLTLLSSPKILSLKEILRNRFRKASKLEINQLLSQVEELHLPPQTVLFEENEETDGAYLILTGKVREVSD